ncbi:RAVE subunit 2/Rogdi [Hypoxylon sp. FL1284]|nr:RAVE subunit 2/Rogdi [Hypoxylon sp. FL1284]
MHTAVFVEEGDFVLITTASPSLSFPSISTSSSSSQHCRQARELSWLLNSLRTTVSQVRGGLEDCAALLAPPPSSSGGGSSTLALTTPRNETVKGHATREGTRLVRGVVHLKLRTLPPQTLALDPARPVRVPALARLDALLARAVALCLALDEYGRGRSSSADSAPYLASQLRLLAQLISESVALVRGPPRPPSPAPAPASLRPPSSSSFRPSSSASNRSQDEATAQQQQQQPAPEPDTAWTRSSVSLGHFAPPLSRNLSLHVTVEDACLVLYLRALEPADAPVNFGARLALAIGTARRLEHDEADRVFAYRCDDDDSYVDGAEPRDSGAAAAVKDGAGGGGTKEVDVYVREKVRVESADPSLLSLSAKLNALSNTLDLARRNLAAVMGEDMID